MAFQKDYFGFSKTTSLILAIIPFTSWICGAITRFNEGKIFAGILRLFTGFNFIWLIDLILIATESRILRLINL